MYKEYMLICEIYDDIGTDSEDPDAWNKMTLFFETEKDMIDFVKTHLFIRIHAAFKLDKFDNDIFV